jgi:uncharacterized damage-inducible protein DinB
LSENTLRKLIEHNNWANLQIIQACSTLTDDQLDARPQSGKQWSIRLTLIHLVDSQQGYLSLLTLPAEARVHAPPSFAELEEAASTSGDGLLVLARDEVGKHPKIKSERLMGT